ncbi:MAG TPA: peptidoglycan-binding domain-containing protein [Candidatus Binatia bacterium]|nr:peptidoglycan-binding domain-containing protein [Candidatus Binatia bacterium]
MIRPGAKFRNVEVAAVCALTLTCALAARATPPQDSSASSAATASNNAHKTPPAHHSTSSSTGAKKTSTKSTGKHSSHKKSSRVRGQQKIDSERALSIQQALIREHYLTGEPSGTWNQASEDAMRKYQADHGWQSKTVPDSRALISLGLGPSKDHLLNPESAMTTVPDPPKSDSSTPSSHTSPATSTPAAPSSSVPAATSTPTSDPPSPQ